MSHSAPRKDAGTRLPDPDTVSAFHQGERSIQRRLGVREKIESWGQRGLRDYMLEQHREFFEQLEYFFVGTVDTQQRPWASLLTGEPGFLRSPDPETLCVSVELQRGDPLAENLKDGIRIGGLGIQLHSRRRNRVNGTVTMQQGGFAVRVHQSFGNCAQYIQARRHRRLPPTSDEPQTARTMTALDAAARTIIARADTFFVASAYVSDPADRRHGVDVSHRGGPPGQLDVVVGQPERLPRSRDGGRPARPRAPGAREVPRRPRRTAGAVPSGGRGLGLSRRPIVSSNRAMPPPEAPSASA